MGTSPAAKVLCHTSDHAAAPGLPDRRRGLGGAAAGARRVTSPDVAAAAGRDPASGQRLRRTRRGGDAGGGAASRRRRAHRRTWSADLRRPRCQVQCGGQRMATRRPAARVDDRHPGPQPPRTTRRAVRRHEDRCPHRSAQHRIRQRPDPRRDRAGGRRTAGVRRRIRRRGIRYRTSARPGSRVGRTARCGHARSADRTRRSVPAPGRRHEPEDHHLDQRDHRNTEGSAAIGSAVADPARGIARQDAVPYRGSHRMLHPDVSFAGLRPRDDRDVDGLDAGGSAQVRPAADAGKPGHASVLQR